MKSVTGEQMKKIDEELPGKYGVTVSRLMENAGYQIADFIRRKIESKQVTVYVGKGDNGGDALSAARRLRNWNYTVEVVLATEGLTGIRKEELQILENLGIEINLESSENNYEVALDGLLGYGIKGDPRPPFDSIIEEINQYEQVGGVDLPSGLHPDSGKKAFPCVEPDYTVTLGMPKKGMSEENSGEIWVADISIPRQIYEKLGYEEGIFEESSLVRL